MKEIRRYDKHNFTVVDRLSEPKSSEAFGTTLVQTHKTPTLFYGDMQGALFGYCKHNGIAGFSLDDFSKFRHIKPSDEDPSYAEFVDRKLDISQIVFKIQ